MCTRLLKNCQNYRNRQLHQPGLGRTGDRRRVRRICRVHGDQHRRRQDVGDVRARAHGDRGDRAMRVRRRRAAALLTGRRSRRMRCRTAGAARSRRCRSRSGSISRSRASRTSQKKRRIRSAISRAGSSARWARWSCSPRSRCSVQSAPRAGARSSTPLMATRATRRFRSRSRTSCRAAVRCSSC